MAKSKRPFVSEQLRTKYRTWELIATNHPTIEGRATVTGKKKTNGEHFEIGRLADMETALRMGKRKIDRLEGPENWIEGYEDEALL